MMSSRPIAQTIELDETLAEIARLVRTVAMMVEEPEIAVRADRNHRRASELANRGKLRASGYFNGGGYDQNGNPVEPNGC